MFFTPGTSLPASFLAWFLKKVFLTLYSIKWPNLITAWLPLLRQILGNMFIVISCCPVCDAIIFKINLNLLMKPFFHITKKSRQKCKYLKNEKSLSHDIKRNDQFVKRNFQLATCTKYIRFLNHLSVKPTKWSNQRILWQKPTNWVCFTILWGWRLRS